MDIASWIDAAAARLALPGEPAAASLPDSVSGWVQAVLDPWRYEALRAAAGFWAPLFSLGLMLAVSLLPLPAETVAIVNGMVFGRLGGFVRTRLGARIAASVAFAIGRQFGRPGVARFVPARALGRRLHDPLLGWLLIAGGALAIAGLGYRLATLGRATARGTVTAATPLARW